ncbi:nucleotidyltransferase family protein [Tessaracoccus defluvii]
MATQFNLAVDQVKDDVSVFLGELESAGLIEQSASVGGGEPGLSAVDVPWQGLRDGSAGTPMDVGALRHIEGIEIAYAVAHAIGVSNGIRVLAIKGLVGVWHGLREPRIPSDVDVLVHPADFDRYLAALGTAGWRSRLGEFNDFLGRHHSVTVLNEKMPCDIDVHRWWPGFLADPGTAFENLWARSLPIDLAARQVPAADQASSILLMALHSLRSSPDNPRHRDELRYLCTYVDRLGADSEDLAGLAHMTGADVALEGVLSCLGVPSAEPGSHLDLEFVRSWRERSHGRMPAARVWWRHVRGGSLLTWPGRVKTALWPSEELFRAGRNVPPGRTALNEARRERLFHGLRTLPAALLAWAGIRTRTVVNDSGIKPREPAGLAPRTPGGRSGG